ncbi:DUF6702 family protein [Mangrovimonas aestuarii]|uniref:DUF6702 family protein n=1 Tax=Mangrovimonas aestuarii TaxID=3018443 RepID=UPI00237894EE|nr:DUF6702 family protein [Mangrovimonas aestuarii]
MVRRRGKFILLGLVLMLTMAFNAMHKYYVSITQIEYVEEKQSLQVISRIFIDDFENLLRQRYDESITLAGENEPKSADLYMGRYLQEKIRIKINGEEVPLKYLGKEYDNDLAYCYLEVVGIKSIDTFEITNAVLFDIFEDQQNIIRTKINSKNDSFILIAQNEKGVLNF